MLVLWMLYAVVLTTVVAAAAWLGERALTASGRPARGLWLLGMLVSVLAPAAVWATAEPEVGLAVSLGAPTVVATVPPPVVEASTPPTWRSVLARVDRLALPIWGVGSVALLIGLVTSVLRLARRGARWRAAEVDGVPVRISHDTGPAVVGVWKPRVVLPAWVLNLPRAEREWILRHERAHVEAHDPRLVLAGFALIVAVPWNPLLWWQFVRLRAAVEVDCDRRVVRGRTAAERRRYGTLLVEVGRRTAAAPRPPRLAAFAESSSHLERRIRTMLNLVPALTVRTAAFSAAAGIALLAAACLAPAPDRQGPTAPDLAPEAAGADRAPSATVADRPTFTPYTVAPDVLNRTEIAAALAAEYPPLLRGAGVGGTVRVWFFIDETGTVQETRVQESSGHAALDEAALRVAATMRFTAALNRDRPVPVWVNFPITFEAGPEPGPADAIEPARDGDGPVFTPYALAPTIENRADVQAALEREYPAELRDRGVGGTTKVWFHIDEEGRLTDTRISESSGHPAIDEAALEVAATMRFTAARDNDGNAVAVWVSYPITFRVR